MAKTEAMPDKIGLMSIVAQLIAVERNVAPTDSLRVILIIECVVEPLVPLPYLVADRCA